jgi:hypothetical protein
LLTWISDAGSTPAASTIFLLNRLLYFNNLMRVRGLRRWLAGTLPARKGRFRVSAKTTSWEQVEAFKWNSP